VAKNKKKKQTRKENAVIRYLRDTMAELRRVRWPTLDEAWHLTKIVLLVTVAMALLLSVLDFLFSKELEGIITGNAIAIGVLVVALVIAVVVGVILSQQTTRTV
jgi:preprotein translocase subunit SecE